MTPEQLLKPRYKVIADYPSSPEHNIVGFIYEDCTECMCDFMSKYPHLFKRLDWVDGRSEEELPEYFKRVYEGKTLFYRKIMSETGRATYEGLPKGSPPLLTYLGYGLPTTKEEYENSTND